MTNGDWLEDDQRSEEAKRANRKFWLVLILIFLVFAYAAATDGIVRIDVSDIEPRPWRHYEPPYWITR